MNPTITRLAFSSLLGRARSLSLLALPAVLLLVCLVARVSNGGPLTVDGPAGRAILAALGLVVVVPMMALLVTTRLLGTEMEDGTIYYLLSTPIPRWQVVTSKLLAGVATTVALGALPLAAGSLILDHTDPARALGWGAGGVAAAVAYSGLFMALSATTKHSVVWGLLYLMVWEGTLRGLLGGIAYVSVSAWATRVAGDVGSMSVIAPHAIGLGYALVALTLVLVLGTVWAAHRLRGLSLTGD